jgi:hypothetical protein
MCVDYKGIMGVDHKRVRMTHGGQGTLGGREEEGSLLAVSPDREVSPGAEIRSGGVLEEWSVEDN